MVSRRLFIKDGGLVVLGLSIVPGFVYRTAMAARPAFGRKKKLITIRHLLGSADFCWRAVTGTQTSALARRLGPPVSFESRASPSR